MKKTQDLLFIQLQKGNEDHYRTLLSLMEAYNRELREHRPDYPITEENVAQATRSMLAMQQDADRHLEICYDRENGGQPIGFLYGKIDHKSHKGFVKPGYGYIMEFYVQPAYRRMGCGKAMFQRLEGLFAVDGATRMYLNAAPVTGVPFWTAIGFTPTDEIQPHNHMIIYEKEIYTCEEIADDSAKSAVCSRILSALPCRSGIPEAVDNYSRQAANMPFFVCRTGGASIGFAALECHNDSTMEIHVMGVLPAFHRRGVGRMLINCCEQLCRKGGYDFLTVKTLGEANPDEGYAKTCAFYRAMGFRPLEILKGYWDPGNPCLLMAKEVDYTVDILICDWLPQGYAAKIAAFQWHTSDGKAVNGIRRLLYDGKSGGDCFHVLAVKGEDVVARLFCLQNPSSPGQWYYGDLAVEPVYRCRRIATRMVEMAVRQIAQRGGKSICTYVDEDNIPSLALQASLGFAEQAYKPFAHLLNDGRRMYVRDIPSLLHAVPAGAEEAAFICKIYGQNKACLHGGDISYEAWLDILGNPDDAEENFLICKGECPAAWLRINGLDTAGAWISMLVVDACFRRQGIGTFAVKYAEEYAQRRGITAMRIQTTADNSAAIALYEKLGYIRAGEKDLTTGDGVMRKGYLYKKERICGKTSGLS